MKLADLKGVESNSSRISSVTTCFVLGIPWDQFVSRYEWLEKLTKNDIIEFVRTQIRSDNYAVIYKREGTNPNIVKVDKPDITPAPLLKEVSSEYAKQFLQEPPARLIPVFADFKACIDDVLGKRFAF